MELFVAKHSIVREIWGKSDTTLFIFAGAAAEFALNNAVDWLYFTGRLPADPLGRLFSTVTYAQQIVFSEQAAALKAIDKIAAIHQGVEAARGAQIPDWAYRDVLFMLIDYSIRSYEVLERKLTDLEKKEVFDVFYRVGHRMGIAGLPTTYVDWLTMRADHLQHNMINSHFTIDLFKQYRKHLGLLRYLLLKQVQVLVTPNRVKQLLNLNQLPLLKPVIALYKLSRKLRLDKLVKEAILPAQYKAQIRDLDVSV
ncbi:oxygenase MpaB family protein [Mucilaginibacter lacusdianchii]|uniref:oxygenase MpaB family protein n=1 Tax=Mucilaginibacter lacusdianchii TaxID=2684211 RepID=UPI00131C540C|nr:oxygenase MpaB family protein [Mucilaginibacter sp. JXJ CY 39]